MKHRMDIVRDTLSLVVYFTFVAVCYGVCGDCSGCSVFEYVTAVFTVY